MDTSEAPRMSLRSIGSLFGDTWSFYKGRWSVLVEIVLLPTLVVVLGGVLVGLDIGWFFSLLGGLVIFIGWIMFMFSILPVIYSIHNMTGVDTSYKATIGWFWPFVWLVVLEVLAVMGGYIMLIIPGIWLGVMLSFAVYVFMVEQRRGIDALRQSKSYVKGYWWAVLGRTFLLLILYFAAMAIIRVPVTLVAGTVAGGIVSAAIALFFIPFATIYQYLIFKNLRELKPELAEAYTNEGRGFITASAIVGIAAPVILIAALVIFSAAGLVHGFSHAGYDAPPPGYRYGTYNNY